MEHLGLVATPNMIPSPEDYAALKPSWVRSIIYRVDDIQRHLDTLPPSALLCLVLNNECYEVRPDWSGWEWTVNEIATRFRYTKLQAVECTNEPDIFWSNNHADMPPEFVARLVQQANAVFAPVGIYTLIGSVAGPEWQQYLSIVSTLCRDTANGACFHPYGQRPDGFEPPGWGWGDMRVAISRAYELAKMPIWLTEWGVKIIDAGGEGRQADYLATGAKTIAAMGQDIVPMSAYFCWRDDVGAPHEQGEQAFGLSTTDGRHRPAWDVFSVLQEMESGSMPTFDVGQGLLNWMTERGDYPIASSSFLPLGKNPAEIECAYGASGCEYRWSLVENRRLALLVPFETS